MSFIGNREKNFEKFLKNHFDIVLPREVSLFYAKGIRVGNHELANCGIHGDLGYAACDFGFNPTNALVQNFGHLARKNVLELDEPAAKAFAAGMPIKRDLGTKNKQLIIRFGKHIVGLGYYDKDQKKVVNKIPEKRRRNIVNEI